MQQQHDNTPQIARRETWHKLLGTTHTRTKHPTTGCIRCIPQPALHCTCRKVHN